MDRLTPGPIEAFWDLARRHGKISSAVPTYFGPSTLEVLPPPAWSFGATPEQADALLALVLDGTKTATASALSDYESEGEALPSPGTLSIVVDGAGKPRVLIVTTRVDVVAFDEVDAEHARLEGEGDLSLSYWRAAHQEFFSATGSWSPDMQVVLERFEIVHRED